MLRTLPITIVDVVTIVVLVFLLPSPVVIARFPVLSRSYPLRYGVPRDSEDDERIRSFAQKRASVSSGIFVTPLLSDTVLPAMLYCSVLYYFTVLTWQPYRLLGGEDLYPVSDPFPLSLLPQVWEAEPTSFCHHAFISCEVGFSSSLPFFFLLVFPLPSFFVLSGHQNHGNALSHPSLFLIYL